MNCRTNIDNRKCKVCGFSTDNVFITVCPRCASKLPQIEGCNGVCSGCKDINLKGKR